MLRLILANRHQVGLVQQDVGGHKDWVAIERQARELVLRGLLLLELDHLVQPAERGQSR